jgi:hypothetical protein
MSSLRGRGGANRAADLDGRVLRVRSLWMPMAPIRSRQHVDALRRSAHHVGD